MQLLKRKMNIHAAVMFTLFVILMSNASAQQQSKAYVNRQAPMERMSGLLRLVDTIPIQTEGYIDHLRYDLKGQHLFLFAENNQEVVVIDMKAGKVIHETKVSGNPPKPFFDTNTNELWVDLGDNTVVALDRSTFEVTKTIALRAGRKRPVKNP